MHKTFAEKNPSLVAKFAKVTADAYAAYESDPARFTATSPEVGKIVRLSGAKAEDVPALLMGNHFPLLDEQASEALLGGGTEKAISDTSAFLVEQKKIPRVLDDYGPYVLDVFVRAAAASN